MWELPYPFKLTDDDYRAMIVAMVTMAMVQAPVDQVIIVITVGHALVTATIVATQAGNRVTAIWVLGTDRNHMFIVMIIVWAMQMPIMQIIDVIAVLNTGMTTVFAMYMRVRFVFDTCHCQESFRSCCCTTGTPPAVRYKYGRSIYEHMQIARCVPGRAMVLLQMRKSVIWHS